MIAKIKRELIDYFENHPSNHILGIYYLTLSFEDGFHSIRYFTSYNDLIKSALTFKAKNIRYYGVIGPNHSDFNINFSKNGKQFIMQN